MKKNVNKLTRFVQIMWLIIAAVCVVEAALVFKSPTEDMTSGYLFSAVALFAIFRYITLRRQNLKKDDKI